MTYYAIMHITSYQIDPLSPIPCLCWGSSRRTRRWPLHYPAPEPFFFAPEPFFFKSQSNFSSQELSSEKLIVRHYVWKNLEFGPEIECGPAALADDFFLGRALPICSVVMTSHNDNAKAFHSRAMKVENLFQFFHHLISIFINRRTVACVGFCCPLD